MDMYEYQKKALETADFPAVGDRSWVYPALGLAGEAGEVLEKLKKAVRGGRPVEVESIKHELGDVLWYVAVLANELGLGLEDIAACNIAKLRSRKERGVIDGSGDNR